MEEAVTQQRINPLLERVRMPGETFTLPSGGIFYTNGELDPSVHNAEVRVNPMTALDEIVMKTPDMLFSGDAVREVFARCIPSVIKSDRLLAKDVDFLLVCLRKVSYGNTMRLEQTHNCNGAKPHKYDVDITTFIQKTKRIDPTKVPTQFCATMPNGEKVYLEPIRFGHLIEVLQITKDENEGHQKPEQIRDRMIDSMTNVITRVDEVDDKEMIREWLRVITPEFYRIINDKIDDTIDWGTSFRASLKCHDCGKFFPVDMPLNPLAFFT